MSLFRIKLTIPNKQAALVFSKDLEAEDCVDAAERGWRMMIDDPEVPELTEDSIGQVYRHPDLDVMVDTILNQDPKALPSLIAFQPATKLAPRGSD